MWKQSIVVAILLVQSLLLNSLAFAYNPLRPPTSTSPSSRRRVLETAGTSLLSTLLLPQSALGDDEAAVLPEVLVQATGDAKKLFTEGRAYESQGNMFAAQRVYNKITLISPRFVYGWSNLGNTQTALGDLEAAEVSYTKAIDLCETSIRQVEAGGGGRKCNDLYVLLLNRGSIRLNNGMEKESLQDLARSDSLRGRPDAIVLQNLARAKELNGLYASADRDYTTAIAMSSNEVNPFWLRAALVKFQLGDIKSANDIFARVENRFPEAPEVRAAYAVILAAKGDQIAGQRKFLEIPDRARLKYAEENYVQKVIAWPPAMREGLAKIRQAVGDAAP